MKKLRIYLDTSVFGGKYDVEFELWIGIFFENVISENLTIIYSNVAEDELENAPQKIKDFIETIPQNNIMRVELTQEAILLAEQYIKEKVVGKSSRADCYHIAIATIIKADILVSWNFKHIVNIQRINGYNAINLLNGYQTIEIRTPREVFYDEGNNE